MSTTTKEERKKIKKLQKVCSRKSGTKVRLHALWGVSFGDDPKIGPRRLQLAIVEEGGRKKFLTTARACGQDIEWFTNNTTSPNSCGFRPGRAVHWFCYHLSKLKYLPEQMSCNCGFLIRALAPTAAMLRIEMHHVCDSQTLELNHYMTSIGEPAYKELDRPGFMDIPGMSTDLFGLLMQTSANFFASNGWHVLHTANIFELRVPVELLEYSDPDVEVDLQKYLDQGDNTTAEAIRDRSRRIFVRVLGKGGRCTPTLKIDFNRLNIGIWAGNGPNEIRQQCFPHPPGCPGTISYVFGQGGGLTSGVLEPIDANTLLEYNLNLPGNQATPWARVVNQSQSSTKGYAQQTQRLLTAKEVGLVTFCLHSMTRLTQHIRKTQPAQASMSRPEELAYLPMKDLDQLNIERSYQKMVSSILGTEQKMRRLTAEACRSTIQNKNEDTNVPLSLDQVQNAIQGSLTGHALHSVGSEFVLRFSEEFCNYASEANAMAVEDSMLKSIVASANLLQPDHPDLDQAKQLDQIKSDDREKTREIDNSDTQLCIWCARYGWQVRKQDADFVKMNKCGGCKRAM